MLALMATVDGILQTVLDRRSFGPLRSPGLDLDIREVRRWAVGVNISKASYEDVLITLQLYSVGLYFNSLREET